MNNGPSHRIGIILRLICSTLLLFLGTTATAFARQGEPPLSKSAEITPLSGISIFDLPAVDGEKLLAANAKDTVPGPQQVAVSIAVEISPQTHGQWETLDDGSRIWRLRFQAPSATDLNFGFTRYRLPEGARLHVLSEDNGYFEGPYTAADNLPHFQLWTPMVPGDTAIAELFLPSGIDTDSVELELTRIGIGYRGMLGRKAPRDR